MGKQSAESAVPGQRETSDDGTDEGGTGSRLEHLFSDLEAFRLLITRVLEASGFQGEIVPRDCPDLFPDETRYYSPLCNKIRSLPAGEELCRNCHLEHAEQAARQGKAVDYLCASGLLEIGVPIIVYDQSVATVFFGQCRVPEGHRLESEALAKLQQTEMKLKVAPGTLRELWGHSRTCSCEEVEGAKKDVERIVGFVTDLAVERKDLQAAAEREMVLGQYMQDTAHQLIGPLSGLRAHSENLLRGRVSVERGRATLEALVELAGMAQRYAENIGLVARAGQSDFDGSDWNPELCNSEQLVSILIRCARSFQGIARERRLRGPSVDEVSFRSFPPLYLDRGLFELLMLNLIDNAVKYSYDSSPIRVSGRVLSGEVEIEVTNHGIPLSPEDTLTIFERYTRSAEAARFAPSGTGIGLFVSAQIARLHGGSIRALPSIESAYGNEVKFIVTLPKAKLEGRSPPKSR